MIKLERGDNELQITRTFFRLLLNPGRFAFHFTIHFHQYGWSVYHFVSWHPVINRRREGSP